MVATKLTTKTQFSKPQLSSTLFPDHKKWIEPSEYYYLQLVHATK